MVYKHVCYKERIEQAFQDVNVEIIKRYFSFVVEWEKQKHMYREYRVQSATNFTCFMAILRFHVHSELNALILCSLPKAKLILCVEAVDIADVVAMLWVVNYYNRDKAMYIYNILVSAFFEYILDL